MPTTDDENVKKQRALKLVAHAAKRQREAESKTASAMRFAQEHGASLREISTATGVPHVTVKRIIERAG